MITAGHRIDGTIGNDHTPEDLNSTAAGQALRTSSQLDRYDSTMYECSVGLLREVAGGPTVDRGISSIRRRQRIRSIHGEGDSARRLGATNGTHAPVAAAAAA